MGSSYVSTDTDKANDTITVANGALLLPNVKVVEGNKLATVGESVAKFENFSTQNGDAGNRKGVAVNVKGSITNEGTVESRNGWTAVGVAPTKAKEYQLVVGDKDNSYAFVAQGANTYGMTTAVAVEDPNADDSNIDTTTKLAKADLNLGITCAYPVKTMDKAIETVKTQQIALKALRTQLSNEGMSKEELDKKYPLPSIIYACSPITVDSSTTWDWSEIQDFKDETGEPHSITLRAHEEAGEDENTGRTLHSVPKYIVLVTKGAKLTLGEDVRIVRQLPLSAVQDQTNDSTTTRQTRESEIICNRNAINVIDGAELVLTANANLTGMAPDGLTADSYTFRSYPGNGIVVGTTAPTMSYTYGSTSKGTITIDAGWTGSLSGFGRGVYANGKDTKVVMNGGVIEGNSSSQEGAGIYLTNYAAFEMNGGVIQGNTALYNGAGVYAQRYATAKINKGTIQNNKVSVGNTYCYHSSSYTSYYDGYVSGGAGIFVAFGAELTLGTEGGNDDDCLIKGNKSTSARVYGIGVGSQRASITMYSGRVENNSPEVDERTWNDEYGAGISAYQAKSLKILGGLIQKNGRSEAADSTAMRCLGGCGGGVYIHQDGGDQAPEEILIQNVTIQGNKAGRGGGIYYQIYWRKSGSDSSNHYKVLFKDEKYGAQLDASKNQNGTRCAFLIQAANLPQTLDFTMSGTAWLKTAKPSSSSSSDAYGFYVTGAGANVTMRDNAQIQGYGSTSYDGDAIYISSPSQDVSVLMQDNAKIQYVENAITVYYPQAKCDIRMQQNASINSYDNGIRKEYAGSSASKAAITLANSAKISANYAINVGDSYVANATTVDLIDSSSVTGGYGIYLTGSSAAAAVTMSNNARASKLSDYRSASSVRASLTMKDSAAIDYIYRSYAGCLDVTIADVLSAQGIHYRSDAPRWNKNMVIPSPS